MNDFGAARPGRSVRRSSVTAVFGDVAFTGFVDDHGADTERMRADIPALLDFLAEHPVLARDDELLGSATIFLGGAITAAHPGATWVRTPDLEIAGPGVSLVIGEITRNLITDRGAHQGFLDLLSGWPQARRDEQQLDALDTDMSPLDSPPTGFVLPDLTVPAFHDDRGAVIDYGGRWPGSPDEASYSRVSHPDRFAPLHAVGESMVAFLTERYDVVATGSTDPRGSSVDLRPTTGAPVTVVFTDFPGLDLRAGAFFEGHYPTCGCDACDETVGPVAEEFVEQVLGIVGGGLVEHYPVGDRGWTHQRLRMPSGASSGSGEPDFGPDRADEVTRMLAGLDDGHWPAWPVRGPRS